MSQKPQRYTITAALPYTNGPIHIGHLAGVYVPADIYARYLRLKGKDVLFVCGSDEHGVPITIKAKKEGITPQELVDKYHKIIKDSFEAFGITFDNYSRTSAKIHHETASDFFKTLYDKGKFIEQVTAQLYDEKANQFLADRFVVGTCPKCGNEDSYGDQCERCGTSHNATDLINPRSAITGSKPTLRETNHWFLPLNEYEDWLKKWILEDHTEWKPNVYGQVKSWIDDALKPRAVTRDLDWGIPVPLPGAAGKVLYVWFDAPIGYISATKEWAAQHGKDWEPYWKDANTQLIHFIGKDNIVFHCIIFPAMLKAEGSYILPENVPANEFLNLEGNKLSTSKNWAVWLHEYLEDFPDKQDVLRYVLTANAPETKDNDFTWKNFQDRNNSELAGIFGNFINRVIVLTQKYYEGNVPTPKKYFDELATIKQYKDEIGHAIETFRFREGSQKLIDLARKGNQFLQQQEPWKKIKTHPEEVADIMFAALQFAAALAYLSEPFLPHTSTKLKKTLGLPQIAWDAVEIDKDHNRFLMNSGQSVTDNQEILFPQIEDADIQKQIDKLLATKKVNAMEKKVATPIKPNITFEDFSKMDLRVGTIIKAEKMPKTDKLLVMEVDLGTEVRTIVSGIAQSFAPEEVIGKSVTVLANLAPRKLRGVESQGMILLTENKDKKFVFINPDEEGCENGATIA
ncbi:MAG: methionine--tRNA ligase [Flavobacteriaceae bacterium]|nr:methionine--tRNA ligase [Flavobacteriaceae bacterium]